MSSYIKWHEQSPLLILLFFSVVQTLNFFSQAEVLFTALSFTSVALSIFCLAKTQISLPGNITQQVIIGLVLWNWFIFILASCLLSQNKLPNEWLYIVGLSSYLLLSLKSANIINIAGWLFLLALELQTELLNLNISHDYLYAISFIILMNVVSRQAQSLKLALNTAKTIDDLTGCIQPKQFKKELSKAVEMCTRYSTPVTNLSLQFDKDHKLLTNLGAHQYDLLVRELTQVCQSRLRTTDILCRYTDQAFIILLPGTAQENALFLADDLLKSCNAYEFSCLKNITNGSIKITSCLNFLYKVHEYNTNETWEQWLHNTMS